ncbi:MAG: class II aldolase/adducin family protein [Propylenella sp.]
MGDTDALKEELVTANRILANERVLDSFGHVSLRNPARPDRFLMSRALAPELVEAADIMEFTLEGETVGASAGRPYAERFIHGAIYEARPEIMSVVHNHSPSVIPFSVSGVALRPLMHLAAPIGGDIPRWDIRTHFGDCTNLLVTSMEIGRDLAACLGGRTVALMRGHGSVVVGRSLREAVFTSVYMEINADLQMKALAMGDVTYLSQGEIDTIAGSRAGFTLERGWENWCRRVGRPIARSAGTDH